jgi:hypothetical protein
MDYLKYDGRTLAPLHRLCAYLTFKKQPFLVFAVARIAAEFYHEEKYADFPVLGSMEQALPKSRVFRVRARVIHHVQMQSS